MGTILEKCRETLAEHYGSRLEQVVLYGSGASGSGDSESDIDLLILLNGAFDYFKELRTLADILYPVQLESERLISAKPVSKQDYEQGTLQLYRNAREDGVPV